ncbi:MAG: DMT family transporter [Myxococcaceae bacterium]|jgi:drug/metabolite transporter (DMT)-like permease|nr:DMT family transporter [Myxococcaceae bacterium]
MRVERRGEVLGGVLVAVSGLSFGTLSVFNRQLAAAGLTVPQMLFLRFLGGALVLWSLALARREVRRLPVGRLLGFGALGLLYVAEAWLYFESSQRIPIALTALLLYLFPSLVVLATWALDRRPPQRRALVALALATLGIAFAVGSPTGRLDLVGLGLGAGTALVYTVYVLLGAKVQPGVGPAFGSAVLMTIAALGFGAAAFAQGQLDFSGAHDAWPSVLGLVVIGTAVPIPLLLFGMTRIGAARASIISTLEPISAALCGLALGETLTPLQLVGAGLVVGGVVLASSANAPR